MVSDAVYANYRNTGSMGLGADGIALVTGAKSASGKGGGGVLFGMFVHWITSSDDDSPLPWNPLNYTMTRSR